MGKGITNRKQAMEFVTIDKITINIFVDDLKQFNLGAKRNNRIIKEIQFDKFFGI